MSRRKLMSVVPAKVATQTGKTMEYNLFVPEGYDGTASYPLVLFMAA